VERVRERYADPRTPGERFRDLERLRQKTLQASCAEYDLLIRGRELIEAEHRDHVFQILVVSQARPDVLCDARVPLADEIRIEKPRIGSQRIDGGVKPGRSHRT